MHEIEKWHSVNIHEPAGASDIDKLSCCLVIIFDGSP